ncbi:hypothetical protein DAEQUDRAFT_770296 [Daedalea quercina L-15889]|uniref:Uncharacterized protein n=1 Tax=Daedalea quercina L-15889 TaxID=1314783 RepID=A0A165KZ75_9APHY|nr:hypothetical protein DAEQUDRAFT_770296 [Daedalea quercina L-15889]
MPTTRASASAYAAATDHRTPAAPFSLLDASLKCRPLPDGKLNWPMVSQLLVAPHTFIRNLDRNGPLADDPLNALCGMDALAQVFDATIDLYTQQDLLEDTIHEYANARTMMPRLCDLEDQVVVRATAHDMVPLHDVQYTRDFIISRTFPHLANEDVATIATPYSPCIACLGLNVKQHSTLDCPRYRCPRCLRRQPRHTERMCSANEAEAHTLPLDVHTLADLIRENVFTLTAARSWHIITNHLFLASRPIMNHYPTDLTPVYFCTKVNGAYYDLQRATEQSLHMGTALVTSYTSREEARASLNRMRVEGIPFIDQTSLVRARAPLQEQGDYPPRPLTPYPAARLGTTLAERPMTPIDDSPTGVDENIPPWNWTVDDDFEIAPNSASTPPPVIPPPLTAEERGWIAHRLLTDSPTQEESIEQRADRYRRQLITSEPRPSSRGSETSDVLSTGTEEVVARLTYHRDGTTTFRGVEGS